MKKTIKFIAACIAVSAIAGCEHPETEEQLPYYYTENIAYLNKVNKTFDILHIPSGISTENVKMPFTVGLSKAMTKDLDVKLELAVSGEGLTADNVSFANGDVVTIPAGELTVANELKLSDWKFATDNLKAANYELKVRIKEVAPSADACIAVELNDVTYRINKTACSNVTPGTPSGSLVPDDVRSTWTAKYCTDTSDSSWETTTDLTNDYYQEYYISCNSGYICAEVDLKETTKMTGLGATFAGTQKKYWPTASSIETSVDGTQWTEQMSKTSVTQSRFCNLTFSVPVEARYIRWRFYNDDTQKIWWNEINVYVP